MDQTDIYQSMKHLENALKGFSGEVLRRHDQENIELGSILRQYTGPPSVVPLQIRSSIREDTVVREVARLLLDHPNDIINVLDACCGEAILASRMIEAIEEKEVCRVHFFGVDQDPGCISGVLARSDEFSVFGNCKFLQRQVWDLADVSHQQIDLIVINNAIHEIYPHHYPSLFHTLNGLLHPERGRICIVDMEILPIDEPEAYAINWSTVEISDILQSAGFKVETTRHAKSTTVYQAHVRPTEIVNRDGMRETIIRLLRAKMNTAIQMRRRIDTRIRTDNQTVGQWLVLTGTIARIAEELYILGSQ